MRNKPLTVRLAKRRAVAQALGVFMMLIILFGALYIPLNYVVSQYQSLQTSLWNNNVFDANTLTFMNSYWQWLPVLVLLFSIEYVYLKAQKRGYGE
jgi:hypothetical protein